VTLPLPLVLATQNPDKAREITEIFVTLTDAPLVAFAIDDVAFVLDAPDAIGETVRALPDIKEPPDVEETGDTLEANARIKATALVAALGMPAIADDTGLEVDALNGAPGVRSARYAGEPSNAENNVRKLLYELEGVYPSLRTARFATVALARWPDGREVVRRGVVEGVIGAARRGRAGFGYDPVFVPVEGDGRTFAEMAPSEKHAISHRGRAFRALAAALSESEGG
jgi:XTP/dITP diphosphohydrolase